MKTKRYPYALSTLLTTAFLLLNLVTVIAYSGELGVAGGPVLYGVQVGLLLYLMYRVEDWIRWREERG